MRQSSMDEDIDRTTIILKKKTAMLVFLVLLLVVGVLLHLAPFC